MVRAGLAAGALAAVRGIAAGALAIGALVLAAYFPALGGGFVWDDDDNVTNNFTLRSVDGLLRIWSDLLANQQYYPLTHTSFWVEYRLFGLNPFPYHLDNILLHAGVAFLFWRVLRALAIPAAWLAAALFAVHPVHVESVAWITERKNVLAGVLYLAAALAFLRAAGIGVAPAQGQRPLVRPSLWRALALLLFGLALLSKTAVATLPAALLVVLLWKRPRGWRRSAAALVPFFVLGALASTITAWIEQTHVNADWTYPWLDRFLIAGRAFIFYLGKLLWPAELMFVYPRWHIDGAVWWQYVFPAAVVLVLAAAIRLGRRVGWGPLVALSCYTLTIAPALGFFTVAYHRFSYVQDHFQYLASMGPIALCASALWALTRRFGRRPIPAARLVAGLLLALLAARSARQCAAFHDYEALFQHTLQRNPDAWMAEFNLAVYAKDHGRPDEAIGHYQAAIRIAPTEPQQHNNLGAVLLRVGRSAEAVEELRQARSGGDDPDRTDHGRWSAHDLRRGHRRQVRA